MSLAPRQISVTLSAGLLLVLLTLLLAYLLTGLQSRTSRVQHLPVIGTVNNFALTNQSGAAISLANLRGKVWVADIIFTRCAGPCLKMCRQMKELQDSLPADSRAKLVTLTTDPDYDTPPVLTKHALRFDADTNRWMFLTGTKKEVGMLAANGLKLSAVEIEPAKRASENDLFIHSTRFVIMDKQVRLRGVFETDGEGVDWQAEKKKILAAVKQLEREP
jgi:cytochrome oxidase Cu insertion factor (SCO1/SenC/PrrC family)